MSIATESSNSSNATGRDIFISVTIFSLESVKYIFSHGQSAVIVSTPFLSVIVVKSFCAVEVEEMGPVDYYFMALAKIETIQPFIFVD
jgi:hypothetical protein